MCAAFWRLSTASDKEHGEAITSGRIVSNSSCQIPTSPQRTDELLAQLESLERKLVDVASQAQQLEREVVPLVQERCAGPARGARLRQRGLRWLKY